MLSASILVVEDDARVASLLSQELSETGYRVTVAENGCDALSQAEAGSFDLVILDLNLPDIDGIEVAKRLEEKELSILMLTARADVDSRVRGLYAGASDYVTKPFSIQELLARIHVRLRERVDREDTVKIGDVELDLEAGSCLVSGEPIGLTAQELKLLELLMTNRGRIFSKLDLEDRLYGPDLPGSNTIEVFISNVRKKLAEAHVEGLIETVRGLGYVVR